MGAWLSKDELPPVVLVPPLFDPPQLLYRSRFMQSSYDVLFAKVARHVLFSEYYMDKGRDQIETCMMLRPPEDPNADFMIKFLFDRTGKGSGDAVFRWQRDAVDPHTFAEIDMSTLTKELKIRSCVFSPYYRVGTFAKFPLLQYNRFGYSDQCVVGFRYGSSNLSVGTTLDWLYKGPSSAWFVGKLGKFTAGCQYKLQQEGAINAWNIYPVHAFGNPKNWSFAVDYSGGKRGALNPSFNFSIEIQEFSKFVASYYLHMVVQRKVQNPFEEKEVVAITNYIDLGFEFQQRLDQTENELPKMQVGASWQVNKNVMIKGKLGIANSGIAFLFKSWWQPSFTFSFSAIIDHVRLTPNFGFGLRIQNFGGASYERADPDYVMLTPTKEHLAEGFLKNIKDRPILQDEDDVTSEKMKTVPKDFQPTNTIL